MGKIEFGQGEIHIVLEMNDDALVREFEKVLALAKGQPIVPKTIQKRPEQKIEPQTEDKAYEKTESGGETVSYSKHLKSYEKLSKPQAILAFAEWFGGTFKSKDYFPFAKTEAEKKNFHLKVAALRRSGKIESPSKGLYRITEAGRKALSKKRK